MGLRAIIEIEFDHNTGDIDKDTQDATNRAHDIARKLTDNEPRVEAANVIKMEGTP